MTPDLWRRKFEARIDRTTTPDGCWPWIGERTPWGHGRVRLNGAKVIVSRLVLEETLGRPLGRGEVARHKCDNPPCCRPDHLEPGTETDNARDKVARGRHVAPRGLLNGAHTKPESRRGERNARARLTPIDVRMIRVFAGLMPDAEIAAHLGCSRSAVFHVRTNRTWTHI